MQVFDFVIVGGGSAGCVLANRLSAQADFRVCLIEAGPSDWNPLIRIPSGIAGLVPGTHCAWPFWSEPQRHLNGRRLYQVRGKTLGGSSAINAMVCARGHASDYDRWAALGCSGWSYAEVLPLFRRMERFTAGLTGLDRDYHGVSGPLCVSEPRCTNPLSLAFVEAAQQAGYQANADFNGAEQEGVGRYHLFLQGGERCSNARAYLPPEVRQRPNLTILTGTQATRVLMDGRRACGVAVRRRGTELEISARREVILCAGAFQSPQLLMLSGIGPESELRPQGIELRVESPEVGRNLQDHLEVLIETAAISRVGSSLHWTRLPRMLWSLVCYLFARRGDLTSNIMETGGFFRSDPAAAEPDMQWHFAPAPDVNFGFNLKPLLRGYGYMAYVLALRPHSRGHVGLRSANPLDAPLIDPAYLSDERDLDALVCGLRLTREVLDQDAFDGHRGVELRPGSSVQSDAALRDYIRASAQSLFHPVGTCRMGSDATAVVDPALRVRGAEGLRVADASIMPTIIGANTNAAATMIGEKASDLLLSAHR